MSVLAYLAQQIDEATTPEVKAQCQRYYDDYAATLEQIKAADALKDNPPNEQAV